MWGFPEGSCFTSNVTRPLEGLVGKFLLRLCCAEGLGHERVGKLVQRGTTSAAQLTEGTASCGSDRKMKERDPDTFRGENTITMKRRCCGKTSKHFDCLFLKNSMQPLSPPQTNHEEPGRSRNHKTAKRKHRVAFCPPAHLPNHQPDAFFF